MCLYVTGTKPACNKDNRTDTIPSSQNYYLDNECMEIGMENKYFKHKLGIESWFMYLSKATDTVIH